jgi:hypothetical protein
MWDVQNGTVAIDTQIGSISNTDTYIGAADLNGDGLDDLVWQDSSTLAVSIWWDGQQSNSSVIQLGAPLTNLSVISNLLNTSNTQTSSTTLEGITANQLTPYTDITGATTLDDSALPGSLTINLSVPTGQTANSLTHFQNVIANNAGDTITANALGGTLIGGTGNDTFNGGIGNDTLIGGGGSNTMIGGGGTDTYKVSTNDVLDTITNGVSTSNTAAGQVDFSNSTDQNLWFVHSGNNLVVDVLGTTQQVVLQNWYSNTYAQTSEIEDSNSLKLDTALNSLVTAMATFQTNNATFMLADSEIPILGGIQWPNALQDRMEIIPMIGAALSAFKFDAGASQLVSAYERANVIRPIINGLLSARLKDDDFSIAVDDVVNRLSNYLACMDTDTFQNFVVRFSESEGFWEKFVEHSLSDEVCAIYDLLMRADNLTKPIAILELRKRMQFVISEEWNMAIRQNKQPLLLARTFLEEGSSGLDLGAPLFDALQEIKPDILSTADISLRMQWLYAALMLKEEEQALLFKNLGDDLSRGAQVVELAAFITLIGDQILRHHGFETYADASVRHVILPLLQEESGLDWLIANSNSLLALVSGCVVSTRKTLVERLASSFEEADEQKKLEIKALEIEWRLSK